jgi:hypothetical protein
MDGYVKSNQYQSLEIGNYLYQNGERYCLTGFVLHLDMVLLRVTSEKTGQEKIIKAEGTYKLV